MLNSLLMETASGASQAPRSAFASLRSLNTGDLIFRGLVIVFALSILVLMGMMVLQMITFAWPSIERFGFGFLSGTSWNPVTQKFGALPYIYGTVVSSALALLIAGPIALGSAIYLSELCPGLLRNPLSFLVELLAAIPSVVYGLWGIFVLAPILRNYVEPALGSSLGFLPLFQGPPFGVGILAAGLILAIMILPTIAAISRDVLRAVPNTQREAMLALGATRWEVISRAVVPFARSGIMGAVILGLGRALGETMAVTMVIGNRPEISASLFAPAYSMASIIANEFSEATYDLYRAAIIEVALVLLGVTVLLNAGGRLLVWSVSRSVKGRAE
ncbi:MAG: phosphate ABC transporter permease subunit PstC [Dehalococcoidia bacterium]|nr:phosphate ABC transporter permease subunit PstC [Dehalococcoidia bacterium]